MKSECMVSGERDLCRATMIYFVSALFIEIQLVQGILTLFINTGNKHFV